MAPLGHKVQKETLEIPGHKENPDLKDYKAKLGLRVLPGWSELMAPLGRWVRKGHRVKKVIPGIQGLKVLPGWMVFASSVLFFVGLIGFALSTRRLREARGDIVAFTDDDAVRSYARKHLAPLVS